MLRIQLIKNKVSRKNAPYIGKLIKIDEEFEENILEQFSVVAIPNEDKAVIHIYDTDIGILSTASLEVSTADGSQITKQVIEISFQGFQVTDNTNRFDIIERLSTVEGIFGASDDVVPTGESKDRF